MSEQTEHKVDRTGWPAGPWDNEPDKLNWTTKAGLPGMIVRNRFGNLCGYAAVDRRHPWYGIGYDDVPGNVDVHGGLTYSDRCQGHICHIPEPGQPDDVWWFGFDCGHAYDISPQSLMLDKITGIPGLAYGTYKDIRYTRRQVEQLAKQLAAVAKASAVA